MKKKVSKGGQYTLDVEAEHQYIVGYTPPCKLWKRGAPFTPEASAEFKHIVDILNPLAKGKPKDPTDKRCQIYDERTNLGMDNHFSEMPHQRRSARMVGSAMWPLAVIDFQMAFQRSISAV